MFNKKAIIFSMILIIIAISGCKKKDAANKDEEIQTVFAVDTVKALKGEINNYIKLSGEVKARREVKVYPDQSGKIAVINTNLGGMVTKGQTLLQIDPSRPGMIYSNSPVNSPISGTVTNLPFKIGETINVQTPVASIGNLDDLEIIANVSEKYISKMKKGLKVIIDVDAYKDITFTGEITELSPVVDPASRMLETKITINESNLKLLKPGMYANLKIITETKTNTVKIPSQSIIRRYGDVFVFVTKNIPTEIDNFTLQNKLIKVVNEENLAFILAYFPKKLPEELRLDVFEYRLLKSLKNKEDIDAMKAMYTFNKESETYQLNREISDSSQIDTVWNILITLNYKYVINAKSGVIIAETDEKKLRDILIDNKIIEETTKFAEKRIIKPGIEIDNKTEVNSGLKQNEEIIFYGQSLLENNSRIRIMNTVTVLTKEDIIK
ncbi:MAG: hypothetical protein A2015_12355 [Spirochaetes bacterium GWF1_31_7]|nr:MAG: hypothetical protein A2Y30_09300 [Spirochaetes bacterium GWE1_32_154]OHD49007.1 MAG: hypothetical protein A2Y29_17190 [Spirochaetes bacterium GWE2_31_10]OHD49553.1 MAG: hypothetical protein A2015_12355 [Spirochaetes bacterium GWF1_31_7]HBD95897.1 hypothetical protein [Spirochaetia bacterium]HBI36723.1 hypothetical protein [Spirochaetia bacterium]